MSDMRRREFITLVGGGATAWPFAARAQQTGKLPTIGFLGQSTRSAQSEWVAAFVQRLHEVGWLEGRTAVIDYRWAEGREDRYAKLAAEFVRLNVDIIVTSGTPTAMAAKRLTATIPIVFATAVDPVENNLVASLARPGGNVTGLSVQQGDLVGKRIELLREGAPDIRRLAILANISNAGAALEMGKVQTLVNSLGLQVITSAIRRAEDIAPAFGVFEGQADALYVCGDALTSAYKTRISTLALKLRLPTIGANREFAEAAGLMSYGPNFPDLYRRAAELVDKILRGTKPGDIPVEQPTKFDLVINLTTAKALGIEIPPTLLARADEVIE
jgi:putative ABC transport system substrate-binding protein